MSDIYDLIVIGGGPAGYVAAERAAHHGKRVLLAEREHLGGVCLNWGCIPTKTLLASAKHYAHARHGAEYGVTAEEVAFDLGVAMKRKARVVGTLRKGVAGLMKRGKVAVVSGEAVLAGERTVRVGDETYAGDKLLICTGSRPARPPIPGADLPHVLTSKEMLDIDGLPERLVIIGGGVIGVEFACFAAMVGVQVTVVEMLPEIAPGVDADCAKILRQELGKQHGVEFHLGAKVTGITEDAVLLTDAAGTGQQLPADLVLMSVGRVPNVEGLGLEEQRIELDGRAIRTDERMRTNQPGVYAAGDVTGRSMLAHSASRMAEVAVNDICGVPDRMRYDAIPGVIYTQPEVAVVGRSEAACAEEGIPTTTLKMPMSANGRFLAEFTGRGLAKIVVHEERRTVLGVQLVGGFASELIHSACIAIENELTVDNLREIIYPHPTQSEVMREPLFQL